MCALKGVSHLLIKILLLTSNPLIHLYMYTHVYVHTKRYQLIYYSF